ncbi:metal-dependent transcriptional regulator [Oscillochloris sp. ZM17-4]|uniref:metal-dependent transcriptional regulator n=1 Tax=Oscillochloris sp. ZM17-4 TaxID=2866714 RepID=UPI001C730A5E|nr:metal-dependent transcriptional regulator [Oscillochloris sp. ZM17-4]MBX0328464.1 metal-dependent transcriptional regulator [Oscillochloris sp. ZM17-4]
MSESEQMYLLTVAMLAEDGAPPPISLAQLSSSLAIQPVSANQMVRKLADAGLLTYVPYRGVELTPDGLAAATLVLRYRRLWEVFLVERLGMTPEAADALACRMEHLTSLDVSERLAQFLGHPQLSPQGRPIPGPGDRAPGAVGLPLSRIAVGQVARVAAVDAGHAARAFLVAEGLLPGAELRLLALGAAGAALIAVADRELWLAHDIAAAIRVLEG